MIKRFISTILAPLNKILIGLVLFFSLFSFNISAHAIQNPLILNTNTQLITLSQCAGPVELQIIQGICTIEDLIGALSTFLITLAPILAVLVITWGGYKYFFSAFTDQKAQGLEAIKNGVLGFVLTRVAIPLRDFLPRVITNEGLNITPVQEFIETQLIGSLQLVGGAVAVLVIIWGGYKYYASTLPGGKQDGKETIIAGVTGLVVIIAAYPLRNLVQATISVQNSELQISPTSIIGLIQILTTNFLIPVSVAVTVFCFVWAAYNWITSQGDPGKVKTAQDFLRNALIGLVISLMATTFTQLVIFFVRGLSL